LHPGCVSGLREEKNWETVQHQKRRGIGRQYGKRSFMDAASYRWGEKGRCSNKSTWGVGPQGRKIRAIADSPDLAGQL